MKNYKMAIPTLILGLGLGGCANTGNMIQSTGPQFNLNSENLERRITIDDIRKSNNSFGAMAYNIDKVQKEHQKEIFGKDTIVINETTQVNAEKGMNGADFYNSDEKMRTVLDNIYGNGDNNISGSEAQEIAKHIGLPIAGANVFEFDYIQNSDGERFITTFKLNGKGNEIKNNMLSLDKLLPRVENRMNNNQIYDIVTGFVIDGIKYWALYQNLNHSSSSSKSSSGNGTTPVDPGQRTMAPGGSNSNYIFDSVGSGWRP